MAKQEPNITVIPVNPSSLLNTKMVNGAFGHYWSAADKGANVLYDLAVAEMHKNNSGKRFDNEKGDFSEAHNDPYNQQKMSN
ncbi:hypothetical protein ACT29H_07380 [Thermophagus sp. OGC60D27]|uniref:hypothetical protein n=1 Tax=Thermophagus sp. OGC60D27 TaxID=3458415 RepID=UPI0040384C5D